MRVYSVLLASGYRSGSGTVDIYTVPVGQLVVLRDMILMHNDAAGGRALGVYLADSGGGGLAWLRRLPSLALNTTDHWTGRQVVTAGGTITLYTEALTSTFYRISGYLFSV